MISKVIGRGAWLCGLLQLAACATVINGTKQQVSFESNPPGATVHIEGTKLTTPARVELERKRTYDVTFEKPGYISAERHIGQRTSGAVWGNIILGGLIGMAVDFGNGAAYQLEPSTVSCSLVPEQAAPQTSDPR